MRRIGVDQRRARLGWRHHLAVRVRPGDPAEVARDLVALQGTDPSSVYVAVWARTDGTDVATVDGALYRDRTLVRLLGRRRTVFVTSLDVGPVVQAACSRAVATRERRKLLAFLLQAGVATDAAGVERWLLGAEEVALSALRARGEATAAELATDDPRLRVQIVLAAG